MEGNFFRERDAELLKKMKADLEAKDAREALTSVSGIKEANVLDALIENKISPESMTAVALIPLVAVAWADGKMEAAESEAILKAAAETGIEEGSASYDLLASWLKEQPSDDLLDSWKAYVGAMAASIEPAALSQLKSTIIGRANGVAESAGGFLGLGNKVSEVELKVMDQLSAAFG